MINLVSNMWVGIQLVFWKLNYVEVASLAANCSTLRSNRIECLIKGKLNCYPNLKPFLGFCYAYTFLPKLSEILLRHALRVEMNLLSHVLKTLLGRLLGLLRDLRIVHGSASA